jgi:acyl carrier protein
MDIQEKLITLILSKHEGVEQINAQSNLLDLGFDSLKFIELVLKIEFEFGIEFDDEDLNYRKFTQVSEVADYIEYKMGAVCASES